VGGLYFEDAGQRSPVRDVVTIVQYNTIAERGISLIIIIIYYATKAANMHTQLHAQEHNKASIR